MTNAMIMKLEHGAELTAEDRAVLEEATANRRQVGAHEDLIQECEPPGHVNLILEGFACRYKTLADGRRSIVAFFVPGDFCDLHVAILGQMDHSIGTITPCTVAAIPRATIEMLIREPRIVRALWWATLVDAAILREWLASMARRPSDQQLAHLLCELLLRLRAVGHANGNSYPLPVTQEELADTLGISAVHVNRMLQQLREDGLIVLQGRTLTIPDVDRLMEFADFDPTYLHLKDARTPRPTVRGAA
ncbi:MAG: Crp/Fnr family transcriptional regulator [Alphaproteobacteria bacterium]